MCAIRDVVTGFQMPGTDIPGFQRKAVEIAVAGIYDLRSHHDDVVAPVLRFWKIWDVEGLAPTASRPDRARCLHGRLGQAGVPLRGQARHPEVPDEHRLTQPDPGSHTGIPGSRSAPPRGGSGPGRGRGGR